MAYVRNNISGEQPSKNRKRKAGRVDRALRWIAIPGFGTALVAWSVATVAGVFTPASSLATKSSLLPHGIFSPSDLAIGADAEHFVQNAKPQPLFQALGAQPVVEASLETDLPIYRDCGAGCAASAPVSALSSKSARISAAGQAPAQPTAKDRFERMVAEAALTHDKMLEAFARSGMVISSRVPALARKQALYEIASLGAESAPDASRFGPTPDRNAQAGSDALALANINGEVEVAYAGQAADGLAQSDISPEADGSLGEPQFQDVPDNVPVPGYRPRVDNGAAVKILAPKAADKQFPAAPVAKAPARRQPVAQPTVVARLPKSPRQSSTELAYAGPETQSGGFSQAFGNLFSGGGSSGSSKAGGGTAIYDISAKTVYLPDGPRLEAHSGLGPWVDNPAYTHKKNVGPTPPDTYILSMRESRFHGVEAIRMTPASGVGKYGRNGILAHTYMLRGRYAQSNGCVVFKNYERFLSAFKSGKIKRLVVVPGRLKSSPGTAVADAGRGA